MNRNEIYALIDDYLDGDLDEVAETKVHAGLDRFPEIREIADRQRGLISELNSLPRSIEPPSRAWCEIADQLEDSTPSRWLTPTRGLLLAASLIIVFLAVGFVIGRWTVPSPRSQLTSRPPKPTIVPANLYVHPQYSALSKAEAALLQAKAELHRAIDLRRSSLPNSTVHLVDENLSIIEEAIGEIRAAIAKDPSNSDLTYKLVGYHEREIELLRQVARATERL